MGSQSPADSANTPQTTDLLWGRGTPCPFSEVVDVRSPDEYADDHIPSAVNLPVLSNAERVEVGTIYRERGAFPARKVGAAYVSANIARHLSEHFAEKMKDYRPLVYCWRGGQRSASLATVLAQVGWRVTVLRGGYKTYRAHVRRELDALPPLFAFRVISGATGVGKTRLLHALTARGAQILDLEGLARHRGSILGGGDPQPSQKCFDSQLLAALDRLTPDAPVWVEAESNRIGDVYLPPALWAKMQTVAVVEVQLSTEARVRNLLAEYANLVADPDLLKGKLRQLTARHGPRRVEAWCRQIDARDWEALVASLLTLHYDPAYMESSRRCYPNVTRTLPLSDATPASINELAAALLGAGCDQLEVPT